MRVLRHGSWLALLATAFAHADGLVVDKIYHPYVDALGHELEYRAIAQDEQPALDTPAQIHKLAFGRTLSPNLFGELYVVAEKPRTGGFNLTSWEAELKWQLTEQGEYAIDWGAQLEYADKRNGDRRELTASLLAETEWGQWSGTANFHVISEWGEHVRPEYENILALQARYRLSRRFEPGIEFYSGQNSRGIGPVLQGSIDMGTGKGLHWEAGVIFALDKVSAERTWRLLFEYEF